MIEWIAGALVVYSVAVTLLALDRQARLWEARDECAWYRGRCKRAEEVLDAAEEDLLCLRVELQHSENRADGFRERIRELKPDEFAASDDAGDVIRAITGGTELPDVE